jgi:hypothetical protein
MNSWILSGGAPKATLDQLSGEFWDALWNFCDMVVCKLSVVVKVFWQRLSLEVLMN